MLARRLAQNGKPTLLIDLFGTGDSAGDFADAAWPQWSADLLSAAAWLRAQGARRIHVVAARAGALLVESLAREEGVAGSRLILWQPVVRGADFWRQFLRLRVAADALRKPSPGEQLTPQALLARDGHIEIAGYTIGSELASGLSNAELKSSVVSRFSASLWAEVTMMSPPELSMGSQKTLGQWRETGLEPKTVSMNGEAFWSTPEIAYVPNLIEATCEFLQ